MTLRAFLYWAAIMLAIVGFSACIYALWVAFKERNRD